MASSQYPSNGADISNSGLRGLRRKWENSAKHTIEEFDLSNAGLLPLHIAITGHEKYLPAGMKDNLRKPLHIGMYSWPSASQYLVLYVEGAIVGGLMGGDRRKPQAIVNALENVREQWRYVRGSDMYSVMHDTPYFRKWEYHFVAHFKDFNRYLHG